MRDSTIIVIAGLACQTAIGIAAVWKGMDTAIVMGVSSTISSIIGAVAAYVYAKRKAD